jgi:putative DNA primase/helicase
MQRMPAKHGQEARAARQFALIGLAGERATQAGITGWPAGWATRTAIAAYEDWIAARGQGNAETVKILHGVRDYLLSYGSSRFSRRPNSDGYSPDADKPIQNRAGYTETTGDSRTCFLIFPAALKEATKGHDFSTVLRELDQAHWLIKSSSNQKRRQLKIQGDNVPVYQILLPNWPTDDDIT